MSTAMSRQAITDDPDAPHAPGHGGSAPAGPPIERPRDERPRQRKLRRRAVGRWVKRILLAIVVLGLGGAIVKGMLPKPVTVDMATVAREPMQVTIDEDGQARVIDRYVVSAPLMGRVARIELDPGDEVRDGDVVARIVPLDPPLLDDRTRSQSESRVAQAQAARAQTAAQMARARASLSFAKTEAGRARELFAKGAIPQQKLEQAEMGERTAKADHDSSKFASRVASYELEMARAALGHLDKKHGPGDQLEVPAPVSGRVLKVLQESEGVVQPGTPLLSVGDPSALEIVVDVLTSDAVKITPGARVAIDRWGGESVEGRVRRVEPSAFTRLSALGVQEQRVNVIIELTAPRESWANLGDGYRVEAHITIWEQADALTIPVSSVFRHGDGWAVYRVDDGVSHLIPVDLGQRNGRVAQVTTGLEAGQSVVVHPSDRIQDGVQVTPR